MQIIKLGATDSTNRYLKELARSRDLEDLTVVVAEEQTRGRGQMGTIWYSENGKNLIFSILKKQTDLKITDRFQLNMGVSLSVLDVFSSYPIPELRIKWPNDILSGTKKMGGILIENIISGPFIRSSIIGMGLNINQQDFEGLPGATSVRQRIGRELPLDDLLNRFQLQLKMRLEKLGTAFPKTVQEEYESHLLGVNEPRDYIDSNGIRFTGTVQGVDDDGRLIVHHQEKGIRTYGLKELKWILE